MNATTAKNFRRYATENFIGVDHIIAHLKDNQMELRRYFYYKMGQTAEKTARYFADQLPTGWKVVRYEECRKPSGPNSTYFAVYVAPQE